MAAEADGTDPKPEATARTTEAAGFEMSAVDEHIDALELKQPA
ncbi:hypothetical protein [Paractinoplanes durhamensis]|nr:hypothetical protein [Actinoplanes durhamensis]